MSWSDYLRNMLEQDTALDDLVISLDGKHFEAAPSILKASILLSDSLLDFEKRSMFIFPELETCSFVFMLLRTLYNIAEGRVSRNYDPYAFIPGEKLKFKSSIFEYIGIKTDKETGKELLFVKFADGMKNGLPLETAPFLQHVQTKRLSKYASFKKEYYPFLKELSLGSSKAFLQSLPDYKTHLDGSSVFVAPILNTKNLLFSSLLNNERVSDLLLLAQSDFEGNISNITAGQLAGTPAIVLCQDLYTVCEAIESGLAVNTIFVESRQTKIDSQMDALDDLIGKNKPIVLLSDQANFTDFSSLESRAFKIWTWNESAITRQLYQGSSRLNVSVRNSGTKRIRYIDVECPEVSNSMSLLNKNKQLIEEQSAAVIQVFQSLLEITLIALRAVTPLSNSMHTHEVLKKCKAVLKQEKDYLSTELFEELSSVQDNLEAVYTASLELPKVGVLVDLLKKTISEKVIIIVPQNVEKSEVEWYLKNAGVAEYKTLFVLYPNEYSQSCEPANGTTFVSGWLSKNTMNSILNANVTPEIITLIYEVEKRWKNGYRRRSIEQTRRSNHMNASVLASIEDSLANDYSERVKEAGYSGFNNDEESSNPDELDGIELAFRRSKYRGYISTSGADSVLAVPVSFVGDLIAFYRTGRTLLTATKLINEDYDKIEEVKPQEVQTGDFVIERESQRDLIRDIADVILINSNCSELRETSHKWKEALEVESVFFDEDAIFEKLMNAGCTRGRMTVHNWLTDDNMITPKSKDDIVCIARATEDLVLLEMVEQVFDAGKVIKSAHSQAGRHLANKLRKNLANALSAMGSIDGFNVWQPIEIEIEEIGVIKLLKVIDVGAEVQMDASSTNRLINTNRVVL